MTINLTVTVACPGCDHLIDVDIAAVERELEHADAIALMSVGQPDRAESVAYREKARARLDALRSTTQEGR